MLLALSLENSLAYALALLLALVLQSALALVLALSLVLVLAFALALKHAPQMMTLVFSLVQAPALTLPVALAPTLTFKHHYNCRKY